MFESSSNMLFLGEIVTICQIGRQVNGQRLAETATAHAQLG